jgi:putative hydrolase of the HAD superfamily
MKVFLFDIGNVLCDFTYTSLLETYEKMSGKPVHINEPDDQALYYAVESGELSDASYVEQMNQLKELNWTVEDLITAWQHIFSANKVGRSLFSHAVSEQVPVYTLSNIAAYHIEAINRNWSGFLDQATGLFLSYQLGYRKPHPRIYEKVVEQLSVEPSSCFFIDDLPENIEAARAMGMQAELFLPSEYQKVMQKADQFFGWSPLAH